MTDPRLPTARSHYPVVIVGAGPVGSTLAIDLATRGVPVVVLEQRDHPSEGSRAICWSKRTLEIFDRLGVADGIVARGITWSRGKVFFRDRPIYEFDLLPEPGHRFPAFVNLQQSLVEELLRKRTTELAAIDLPPSSRVIGVEPYDDRVAIHVESRDGVYDLTCDYLVAADGVRSTVRKALGLAFEGQIFDDRFLIADVAMKADFPTERWFWFDPPFHPGRSALLHRQADGVWRIDMQLGADADPEVERRPERVIPRIRAMLGPGVEFELVWVSVYTFQCRRLERFVHGRVLFAGDSAHTVSPFGARGGNGGIQDADNLGWKLAAVLSGIAPSALLASYDLERIPAADENSRASTRSTDFITPKNAARRTFRQAALELARAHPFARRIVNSGRLSLPHVATASPLFTDDAESFAGEARVGAPAPDAPIARGARRGWLLGALGRDFTVVRFGDGADREHTERRTSLRAALPEGVAVELVEIRDAPASDDALVDVDGTIARRYDGRPGTTLLFRPDQHLAARWRRFDPFAIGAAIRRALAIAGGPS